MSTDNSTGNPSVVNEGGNNNYNMSGGMSDADRVFFQNMLTSSMQQIAGVGQPSGRQNTEQRNVIKGNYYGSVVGNIPIITGGAPIVDMANIDRLYREGEARKLKTLEQDKIQFQTMMLGGWNEKFLDYQKQLVDTVYEDYLTVYKDPSIARKAMTQSDNFNTTMLSVKGFADDFNSMAKFATDSLTNPEADRMLSPSAKKAMSDFMYDADSMDKFVRKDSSGKVVGFDTKAMTAMRKNFQLMPSVLKLAQEQTKNYEIIDSTNLYEVVAAGTDKAQVWKYSTTKNANYEKDLDRMTDRAFEVLNFIGSEDEAVSLKSQLRDQIEFNIKRSVEDKYLEVSRDLGALQDSGLDVNTMQGANTNRVRYDAQGNGRTVNYTDYIGYDPGKNKIPGNSAMLGTGAGGWMQITTPGYNGKWLRVTTDDYTMEGIGQGRTSYTVNMNNIKSMPGYVIEELKNKGYLTAISYTPGDVTPTDMQAMDPKKLALSFSTPGGMAVNYYYTDNWYDNKLGRSKEVTISTHESEARISPETYEERIKAGMSGTITTTRTKLKGIIYDPATGKSEERELPDNLTTVLPSNAIAPIIAAQDNRFAKAQSLRASKKVTTDSYIVSGSEKLDMTNVRKSKSTKKEEKATPITQEVTPQPTTDSGKGKLSWNDILKQNNQ